MDVDFENLTVVSRKKADSETCPKCDAEYPAGATECPNCGVLFGKIKSPAPAPPKDDAAVRPPPSVSGNQRICAGSEKRKPPYALLVFIAVFLSGAYYLYATLIESKFQAQDFRNQLDDFCNQEISQLHPDHAADGEDPFRTGKVLIVSPRQEVTLMNTSNGQLRTMVEPQGIHPAWHKLRRSVRAKGPAEVDTLLRVHKIIGKAGRYGKMKTKVFTTHKIVLDVYDWKNQTFIGTKIFDPGEGSAFMAEEDYEVMVKAVSDKTIAEYVQSMGVRQ
jgi:ribosomal protein L40E